MTAAVSHNDPCRNAANRPMGIPKPIDRIMAAMLSWAETHILAFSSSATVRPRYLKLSPKSPLPTFPMYRPYCTKMLSFRPRCSLIRSTTAGLECWPISTCTGSPGPYLPSTKVTNDTVNSMMGSHSNRRAMYPAIESVGSSRPRPAVAGRISPGSYSSVRYT